MCVCVCVCACAGMCVTVCMRVYAVRWVIVVTGGGSGGRWLISVADGLVVVRRWSQVFGSGARWWLVV